MKTVLAQCVSQTSGVKALTRDGGRCLPVKNHTAKKLVATADSQEL